MKKIISLLIVLLLFSGCTKKEEKDKLIVGFDADFPPFGYVNEKGEYDGFDLALAKEVCKRLNLEYEEVAINWEVKDEELKSGNINCIWNGFTKNGRENDYTFTDAYVDNSIVIVVKEDSNINRIEDLKDKKLMVQSASSGADALYDNAEILDLVDEVIQLPDYNLGFLELDQNTVDAIVVDKGVAKYQIANRNNKYRILEETISNEQYAVGFLLGNTKLRDLINNELIKMAEDGTMLEIAKQYEDLGLSIDSLCMLK